MNLKSVPRSGPFVRAFALYWAQRLFLLLALGLTAQAGRAQSPPPLPNPNVQISTFGPVTAMVRLSDGSVVIGGIFTSLNGTKRSNLAKLRPDGTLDPDWNPQGAYNVLALAADASDNVYVGASFSPPGGPYRQSVAKLSGSGTGTIDPNWNPAPDNQVAALAVDAAGNVYAGGYFTNIGGQARNGVAKLTGSGGAADPNWNPSATGGAVLALALDSGGNVFAGGNFTAVGGQARSRIAKLSGSGSGTVDASWNPSANSYVWALTVDGSNNVYAGGYFSSIGGQTRYGVARLSGSGAGAVDTGWSPAGGGLVLSLALDASGNLYVGGSFNQFGGQPRNGVTKISNTGVVASWNPSPTLAAATLTTVRARAVDAAGANVYVGGDFNMLGGQPHMGLGKVSAAGIVSAANTDTETASGTLVSAIAAQPGGGFIVGGTFLKANGLPRGNLLRLQADGTLDTNWNPSANNVISALAVDSSGDVYAGGYFTAIGGQSINYLAKLAGGSTGSAYASWNPSPNGYIWSLAVDSSNNVYAGGGYSSIGGKARTNLAKLSASSGAVDATWNPSPNDTVRALALDAGGNVYAGGYFTSVGGQARQYSAKLSGSGAGSVDANWNVSASSYVMALAVDGNNVYAAGRFTSFGSQSRAYIAKLTTAGVVDPNWSPAADSNVNALSVGAGGYVFAGGAFNSINGQSPRYLAKLSGATGSVDANWNPSPDAPIYALARDATGNLYVGGQFAALGATSRSDLAAVPASLSTTTTITSTAASVVGESYTVSVTVNASSGTPDGTISVTDDAAVAHTCGPATLSSGTASCTITWAAAGTYNLTATYTPASGSSFSASTSAAAAHVVNKGATAVMVTPASGSVNLGSAVTVNVRVAALSPAAGVPSGAISVSDGSASCAIASLDAAGTGSCLLTPFSPGSKTLTANYAGDANYFGGSGTAALQVVVYAITASVAGGNGTIAVTTPSVNYGGTANFMLTPAAGYHVASVSGDTCTPTGAASGGVWTAANITANCAVTASFAINTYTVTASAPGGNGTVAVTTPTVNYGGTASFALTPATGYHVANVTGDTCTPGGASSGGTWTAANITANCAVTASFAINTYTITASVSGSNGTITVTTPTVNYGNAANLTLTPATGYHVASVAGDTWTPSGASRGGTWTATNITANCTVTATFAINTYTIAANIAGGNGTIAVATPTVNYGDAASFTLTPATGYHVASVTGDTCTPAGASSGGTWTATNIAADCTVTASFAINTYAIAASVSGGNGTIAVATPTVNYGDAASFTLTPATGYHVASVTGDTCTPTGASTGGAWVAANVKVNCTVTASFAINTYVVDAEASGGNGTIAPPTQTVNYSDTATFTLTPAAGYSASLSGDTCAPTRGTGNEWAATGIVANCKVTATFSLNTYVVAASVSGGNGTVAVVASPVPYGGSASFTVAPALGYHVANLIGDTCTPSGAANGGTWTAANITANCTVTATFAINVYDISASTPGGGTITVVAPTVNYGGTASFTLTPATGHHLVGVSGDTCTPTGAPGGGTWTAPSITANCTVIATFAINTYDISAGVAGGNGTIAVATPTVNYAGTASFTLAPAPGYHVAGVSGDTCTPSGASSGGTWTAQNVSANCAVTATFAINTYAITASAPGGNGTIAVVASPVDYGGMASFVVTPASGYRIASVNGDTCTPSGDVNGGTWTAAHIVADCSVLASFSKNPPPVAEAQSVHAAYNAATPITLSAQDANAGGPYTFGFAIVTPPAHGSVTINGAVATYTPAANYSGADAFTFTASDVNGTSVAATVTIVVASPATANIVLTSSGNPSTFGQAVTFSATVSLASATPTANHAQAAAASAGAAVLGGSVAFSDNGTSLATVALDANGHASYTTGALGVGSHTITATYSGDALTASASIAVIQQVSAAPTVAAVPAPALSVWALVLLAVLFAAGARITLRSGTDLRR